jgi:MerR family transcriptional regulator, mercuric resistance operon regulatory protein
MHITIGTLAKKAKVNLQTLRYYEQRGLLAPVRRAASGYRFYDEESLRQLKFIRHAQDFGFSLKEISYLSKLKVLSPVACHKARLKAQTKVAQIGQKIENLERISKTLNSLIAQCRRQPKGKPCPLLARFYRGGNGHS